MSSPASLPSPTSPDKQQFEFNTTLAKSNNTQKPLMNTLTPPPATDHPLPTLSNDKTNQYLDSTQPSSPQKQHTDEEEQTQASKTINKTDLPSPSSNDCTEHPNSANPNDDEKEIRSTKRRNKRDRSLYNSSDYPERPHSADANDNQEETRPNKRRNTRNLPLPSNNDSAGPNEETKSYKREKKPIKKTSQRAGRGRKRQSDSGDEGEERKVKLRLTVNEEAAGDDPSRLAPQEYDGDYVKTFGHKMSLAEANTSRCIPNDEAREMYRKSKEMAEKVGYIIYLFFFLSLMHLFIYS
jgi:hypothetical protein